MRGGSGLLFVQPGLFRLGGICFLPLAGGAPYTEGGAHGVPPFGARLRGYGPAEFRRHSRRNVRPIPRSAAKRRICTGCV